MTAAEIRNALRCGKPGCDCARPTGNVHCPGPSHEHGDADPSLSVREPDRTSWPLLTCFKGCSFKTLVTALRERGLIPELAAFRVGGSTHYRRDRPGQPKEVWWDRGAVPTRALYRAEALAGLPPGSLVLLLEGEPATDAAVALGFDAVGTSCGAGAVPTLDALGVLRGFDVVVGPDNDEAGATHMARIAGQLATIGVEARWLAVPDLPPKGDLADYRGSAAELERLIASATADVPVVAPVDAGLPTPIDWAAFWATDHKAEDWLIEPIVPRGRSVAIYSPAKGGKSLLALDLAARAATGRRVLGRPPGEPISAIYLDLEMTEADVKERLEDMGYGPEDDLSRLAYYPLPRLPSLDSPEGGAALLLLAGRHAAQLIIIDTTSRVIDGAENDSDTMRAFHTFTGSRLKAAGVTVLRLDHAGKDPEKGQRGTSAKNDDVDLVWQLIAQDNGVRLKATHRRQSWVPESVEIVRLSDPLRHELAVERGWPPGTVELARLLDEVGAPPKGARAAAKLLREHGHQARNDAILTAMRYRATSGNTSGNTSADGNGERVGEQPRLKLGEHLGERGEHPSPDTGEQFPPPVGEHCPSPTAEGSEPADGDAESCWVCGADPWTFDEFGIPWCELHAPAPVAS